MVTSIAQLQSYAGGIEVELPAFADGQPFVAKLRRPSLMALAKSGKIPNSLLSAANKIFYDGGPDTNKNTNALNDMYGVLEVICEASFAEPTYDEIREIGIQLTDEQMMAVFSYSQKGVEALQRFRKLPTNN